MAVGFDLKTPASAAEEQMAGPVVEFRDMMVRLWGVPVLEAAEVWVLEVGLQVFAPDIRDTAVLAVEENEEEAYAVRTSAVLAPAALVSQGEAFCLLCREELLLL